MSGKKTAKHMIALMSRQSLKTGRMRNIFVSITIVLAAALLTAILMFVQGQRTETARELSHAQQVGYYNLTDDQVQALASDERIAYQIRVKTGVLSDMDGFSAMPYYVSEMSDEIRIGELTEGTLPEKENEAAVQGAMLERMGIEPKVGSSVTLDFYDGTEETFTVSGILAGGDGAKQFSVFFSEEYAENGSQQILLCVLVGGVILLACVLVIYGVFYLSVIGRIHQFGQLRTIGMTKKQLKKFVSREGRLLFLRSVLIGIVIGGGGQMTVDEDGEELIAPAYDEARSFSGGVAAVCQNGLWGFIDEEGQLVVDFQFADAGYFDPETGSCPVQLEENGSYRMIQWAVAR